MLKYLFCRGHSFAGLARRMTYKSVTSISTPLRAYKRNVVGSQTLAEGQPKPGL
jgi:hypothetical protein